MKSLLGIVALFLILFSAVSTFAEDGFTQQDRELLIELRVKVQEMDKRISELREDMNKRFEQVDKRFDQMSNFLYILAGIFTSLVIAVIGFAWWDRRTVIKQAKKEAIEFIEKEGMSRRILDVLKELSRKDSKLAEVMKQFNLL